MPSTKFITLALVCFMLFGVQGFAVELQLDPSHSRIAFKVRSMRLWVHGHFKKFSGHASYDPKTGLVQSMKVNIDASSVDTNESDRDKHLRSENFFWTDKHKNISFEAHKFEYTGAKKKRLKKIYGSLSIRGKTQPLSLEVRNLGTSTDPWGIQRLGFETQGKIDRNAFGLTWNRSLPKTAAYLFVNNEVQLEISCQAKITG